MLPPGQGLFLQIPYRGSEVLPAGDLAQRLDEVLGFKGALRAVLDHQKAGIGPGQGQVGLGSGAGGKSLAQVLGQELQVAGFQPAPGFFGRQVFRPLGQGLG